MDDDPSIMRASGYSRPGAHKLLKSVDFDAIETAGPSVRVAMLLSEFGSAGKTSQILYIRKAVGQGHNALHTHSFDQTFYILSSIMSIGIEGDKFKMQPGDLITFPAGMLHSNFNEGTEEVVHLAIHTPPS